MEAGARIAAFQYAPAFLASGIELSPIAMPLSQRVYQFPALPEVSFHGPPGLLADSLPDKFGNALIDAWLATQRRHPGSFNAIERLRYLGVRGMGALEFAPARGPALRRSAKVRVDELVELASEVLTHRASLEVSFAPGRRHEGLQEMLRVGTSAGGARAKAIIAWNRDTNEVRSGQVKAPAGFDYWLLKFDGVSANKDKELDDPGGYTVIEYAYALMAGDAAVEMSECRLLEEDGRRHFMTRRFDRTSDGGKLHMQSLAALAPELRAAGSRVVWLGIEEADPSQFLSMLAAGLTRAGIEASGLHAMAAQGLGGASPASAVRAVCMLDAVTHTSYASCGVMVVFPLGGAERDVRQAAPGDALSGTN